MEKELNEAIMVRFKLRNKLLNLKSEKVDLLITEKQLSY